MNPGPPETITLGSDFPVRERDAERQGCLWLKGRDFSQPRAGVKMVLLLEKHEVGLEL